MSEQHVLWYVADPMCSWCWGFSPVISAIEEAYKNQLQISLILGGLRPGTIDSVTERFRNDILRHWREVHERTAQPFKFDGAMPDGFVYDTELPSRAVVTIGEVDAATMLPYFKSVQRAFYAEGEDVTRPEILATLAQRHNVDPEKFLADFHTEDMKQKTQSHFFQAQQAGITGFPTVVMQGRGGIDLLTAGYQPFENLQPKIEAWLAE